MNMADNKPMVFLGYEIKWSMKEEVFEVRAINSEKVLYSSAIGKDCYDWILAR